MPAELLAFLTHPGAASALLACAAVGLGPFGAGSPA
jgi:hypothetical protein